MQVTVCFYSYFKDLTGCNSVTQMVKDGSTLGDLVDQLGRRFEKLAPMRKSMLMAVGVDYQNSIYVLRDGDEISLFPPVQGG